MARGILAEPAWTLVPPHSPPMSATTDRYRISCPTRASTLTALARVYDAAEADRLWRQAAAGIVDPDARDVPVADVRAVCDRIAQNPGLAGVLGASLRVRCDTYECLQRLG